jgi:hypothetical protein
MQRLQSRIRVLTPWVVCFAAAACGGDSNGGGGCGPFTACGGDPTGVWQAQSTCGDFDVEGLIADQGFPAECGDALSVSGLRVTGTLSLGAGSYEENIDVAIDWDMRYDAACISALAEQPGVAVPVPVFCDAYRDALQSDPEATFSDVMCRVSGDACLCDAVQREPVAMAGALQIEGNNLVLGDERLFCARGDELVLETEDPMVGRIQVKYARAAP